MKTLILITLACSAFRLSAQENSVREQGVTLRASELLAPDLLRGPSYRVRELVETDGFMAHFLIDSDFGTFEAAGVPQAKQRIIEIEAIKTLVETSKGDLFAEGLKRSVEQPIDAVKNIVKNPVESVKEAPKTVVHFFSKVGSAIGRTTTKIKESANGEGPEPTAGQIGSGQNLAR